MPILASAGRTRAFCPFACMMRSTRARPRFAASPLERLAACFRGDVPEGLDWVEIIGTANAHLVAPSLYRSLLASGNAARVDTDALAYLRDLDEANRHRNRRLGRQIVEIASALNACGVEPLLIKGAAEIVLAAEPAQVGRMLCDIDLMAADHEVPRVIDTLSRLGYVRLENSACRHSPGSFWRPGVAGAIDVHDRLPGRAERVRYQEVRRERATRLAYQGANLLVPDPTMRLFVNVVHEMLHDEGLLRGTVKFRYLVDLAGLLRHAASAIDWRWITSQRSDPAFSLALELQLAMAMRLLGAPSMQDSRPTVLATALDRRRILKMRYARVSRIEWAMLRRVAWLSRRARRGSGKASPA